MSEPVCVMIFIDITTGCLRPFGYVRHTHLELRSVGLE